MSRIPSILSTAAALTRQGGVVGPLRKRGQLAISKSSIEDSAGSRSTLTATRHNSNSSIKPNTATTTATPSVSPVKTVLSVPVVMLNSNSTSASASQSRSVVTSQKMVEVSSNGTIDDPKLLTKEERSDFNAAFPEIIRDLLEIPDMRDMPETNAWFARVLQYNVPHGKRSRGLSTALAYRYMTPELCEENVRLSYLLGWTVEMLQAFFLVADDIMDNSTTRRGRPCWYKVDNIGNAGFNDAILLEAGIYALIKKHFRDKDYYVDLLDIMHDVTYKTIFGQSLDTRTGQERRMETYNMERYSGIVKYKTSYYSFYLPVALAMAMAGITDPELKRQARTVTLEMGHFFQVQDDYLDCFGDEKVTGKIGTDIQDCKCSWLFVVALQRATPEQRKVLLENYGDEEAQKVERVKQLYTEMKLPETYQLYEEQTYNVITAHIQQMSVGLPKQLFTEMLGKIYRRSS